MPKETLNETYQYRELDIKRGAIALLSHWKGILGFTFIVTLGIFSLGVYSVKTTFQGNAVLSIGGIKDEPLETYNQIIDTLVTDKDVSTAKSSNEKTFSFAVIGSSPASVKEKTDRLVKEILDRHAATLEQKLKTKNALLNGQIDIIKQSLEKNQKNLASFQAVVDRLSSSNFAFDGQGLAAQGYLNALNTVLEKQDRLQERLQTLQTELPVISEASKQNGEANVSPIPPGKRIGTMTISAGILALFLACLFAMIAEWWRKNRTR